MVRLWLVLAGGALAGPGQAGPGPAAPANADFQGVAASSETRRVADWVARSDDNGEMPFIIIDKRKAMVFVFDRAARLRGESGALLGRARGDDSVPGIGTRALATIRPEERTTPAGRFVAALGHDLQRDVLWIDYDAAISLHRVVRGNPGDHRLRRLATHTAGQARISYGCVNVPVRFYEDVVLTTFSGGRGIVYILPEVKTIEAVFAISPLSPGVVARGDGSVPNPAR